MWARPYLFIMLLIVLQAVSLPTNTSFSPSASHPEKSEILDLYHSFNCSEVSFKAFALALAGYSQLQDMQLLGRDSILTLIDFSKPSDEERIFVFDLKNHRLLKKTLVAHGKNSGLVIPASFSNRPRSNQSSLGFYITRDTYQGKHGYSLRIEGLEENFNTNAHKRAVVIHGADYVSYDFIEKYGRLGRSFGCPALPYAVHREIIDLIKHASCLFIYADNEDYLRESSLLSSTDHLQTALQ